jgi:hypothetical protein
VQVQLFALPDQSGAFGRRAILTVRILSGIREAEMDSNEILIAAQALSFEQKKELI